MQELIETTAAWVRQRLSHAEGGHDWWHIDRVWRMARYIGKHENAFMPVVELAALVHDIADAKFHQGDESIGPRLAGEFFKAQRLEHKHVVHILHIMQNMSYKQELEGRTFDSLELRVVQDADRLDALGAIGIARAFNYGGFKQRPLFDPLRPPVQYLTKEAYKQSDAPTINHFYEKLLLLKDKMLTPTGQQLALERHRFLENYLQQFFLEWGVDPDAPFTVQSKELIK